MPDTVPLNPKILFSEPMKVGDSTLMMLLSLNLLLLVFFMLLNSMATYGAKHAADVLATVRHGYNISGNGVQRHGVDLPEISQMAWRDGVISRLQGIVLNQIELHVLPQEGNAGKIEMELPLKSVFDNKGQLIKSTLFRNITSAAGAGNHVVWQIKVPVEKFPEMVFSVSSLVAEVGIAELAVGNEQSVKIIISPDFKADPKMGLKIQGLSDKYGASVTGVEERSGQ